jgi:hypothetical protein
VTRIDGLITTRAMEPNDCITKDCSTIYRFQFASIAFLCSVYLPFTFHSNIWSLYSQPFTPIDCSVIKPPFISGSISNITKRALPPYLTKNQNQSDCCPCKGINGNSNDKRLLKQCQEWLANFNDIEVRKATIIDEVSLNLK